MHFVCEQLFPLGRLFCMRCLPLFLLDSQLHLLKSGSLPGPALVPLHSAVTWKLSQGSKLEQF